MLTTLALLTTLSLSPNQADQLSLANVRTTYGALGIVRTDNKVLPGDQVFVTFDIEGITVDPTSGKVLYSMFTEILDGKGKLLHKQEPRDLETINALGGSTVPAFVHLECGLDQEPGDYTIRVTVTDRTTKKNVSLIRSFQVLKPDFGIVRLTATPDQEGQALTAVFGAGQSLWVHCSLVGFVRDKAKGQPDATIELRVLDEKGKPTLTQPFSGQINKDVPAGARGVPVQFLVALNRPGKFTVEIKATDQVAKKTSTLSFPLQVLPSK